MGHVMIFQELTTVNNATASLLPSKEVLANSNIALVGSFHKTVDLALRSEGLRRKGLTKQPDYDSSLLQDLHGNLFLRKAI